MCGTPRGARRRAVTQRGLVGSVSGLGFSLRRYSYWAQVRMWELAQVGNGAGSGAKSCKLSKAVKSSIIIIIIITVCI